MDDNAKNSHDGPSLPTLSRSQSIPVDLSSEVPLSETFELDDFLERDVAYDQLMRISGIESDDPSSKFNFDEAFGSGDGLGPTSGANTPPETRRSSSSSTERSVTSRSPRGSCGRDERKHTRRDGRPSRSTVLTRRSARAGELSTTADSATADASSRVREDDLPEIPDPKPVSLEKPPISDGLPVAEPREDAAQTFVPRDIHGFAESEGKLAMETLPPEELPEAPPALYQSDSGHSDNSVDRQVMSIWEGDLPTEEQPQRALQAVGYSRYCGAGASPSDDMQQSDSSPSRPAMQQRAESSLNAVGASSDMQQASQNARLVQERGGMLTASSQRLGSGTTDVTRARVPKPPSGKPFHSNSVDFGAFSSGGTGLPQRSANGSHEEKTGSGRLQTGAIRDNSGVSQILEGIGKTEKNTISGQSDGCVSGSMDLGQAHGGSQQKQQGECRENAQAQLQQQQLDNTMPSSKSAAAVTTRAASRRQNQSDSTRINRGRNYNAMMPQQRASQQHSGATYRARTGPGRTAFQSHQFTSQPGAYVPMSAQRDNASTEVSRQHQQFQQQLQQPQAQQTAYYPSSHGFAHMLPTVPHHQPVRDVIPIAQVGSYGATGYDSQQQVAQSSSCRLPAKAHESDGTRQSHSLPRDVTLGGPVRARCARTSVSQYDQQSQAPSTSFVSSASWNNTDAKPASELHGSSSADDEEIAKATSREEASEKIPPRNCSSSPPVGTSSGDGASVQAKPERQARGKRGVTTPAMRRLERNQREQRRSNQISQQIDGLRQVLTDAGIPVKASKASILTGTAQYIRLLQAKQAQLETERQRMINEMRALEHRALVQQHQQQQLLLQQHSGSVGSTAKPETAAEDASMSTRPPYSNPAGNAADLKRTAAVKTVAEAAQDDGRRQSPHHRRAGAPAAAAIDESRSKEDAKVEPMLTLSADEETTRTSNDSKPNRVRDDLEDPVTVAASGRERDSKVEIISPREDKHQERQQVAIFPSDEDRRRSMRIHASGTKAQVTEGTHNVGEQHTEHVPSKRRRSPAPTVDGVVNDDSDVKSKIQNTQITQDVSGQQSHPERREADGTERATHSSNMEDETSGLARRLVQNTLSTQRSVYPFPRNNNVDDQVYEHAFSNSSVPLAVVALDGSFIRVNDKFVEVCGYTRDELREQTLFNLTSPRQLHVAFSYVSLVLRGIDPASHLVVYAVTREGKPAPYAIAVSVVSHDSGPRYFST